ncbi:hypothetical protein [Bacillus subtilis]|uniref:hypothetical protein n=1 Tax=Bacillus subtilis TaxID=1423 RepID=UPI0015E6B787|nr:hypothetical protein [Bacillus subtilis]
MTRLFKKDKRTEQSHFVHLRLYIFKIPLPALNEILKIQDKDYVSFFDAEEGTYHFKDNIFFNSIKPILYQSYHLLREKVVQVVNDIEGFLYSRHVAFDRPEITDD